MDERFLSQPDVIAASRKFICVRMMTYESAAEAQVLKSLWRPGAPLENTVFAILSPDLQPILLGGRSPNSLFRNSAEMANAMQSVAAHYTNSSRGPDTLPAVDTVRLAMDVAACDKRPLAIVLARNSEDRRKLEQNLAKLAWSDEFIGKLIYTAGSGNDLRDIRGASINSGYLFVAPNLFGTTGTTIVQLPSTATEADLQRAARQAIASHHPQTLSHHEHVFYGHQQGVQWQTAIPVTDPHSPENRMRNGQ